MDLEKKLLLLLDAGNPILLTGLYRFLMHDPLGFDGLAKAPGDRCPIDDIHFEGKVGVEKIVERIGQGRER